MASSPDLRGVEGTADGGRDEMAVLSSRTPWYKCMERGELEHLEMLYQLLRWCRILTIPVVGIVYWVGLWNLLNLYILEQYSVLNGVLWRDGLYILLGTLGNIIIKVRWKVGSSQQRNEPFKWRNHVMRWLRLFCSVTCGIIFWTGAWNYIDASWYASTRNREIMYLFVSVPLLFLLDFLLSNPVIRHLMVLPPDHSIRHDDDNLFGVWN